MKIVVVRKSPGGNSVSVRVRPWALLIERKIMTKEEVFDKVKSVLIDKLAISEDEVKLESKMVDELGADSLDIVEITMALEDEFEIEILDSELYDSYRTVNGIVELIFSKINS